MKRPRGILTVSSGSMLLAIQAILSTSVGGRVLENHPKCGLTTGGQEECYFDCLSVPANLTILGYQRYVVKDPACLRDCFSGDPKDPSFCLHTLLEDILRKGMCRDDTFLNYTLSDQCVISGNDIVKGTCSGQTEDLLLNSEECFRSAVEQPTLVQNSVFMMIHNSCTEDISKRLVNKITNIPTFQCKCSARINPVTNIGVGYKTQIKYENTRNRYPWLCSLRTHGVNPEHLCAVSLLSIPPQPTILVGAAHCTSICRDRGYKMPSCCCILEGIESCRSDQAKCGQNALVSDLKPGEVDILCGEWELGAVPMSVSEERYNINLQLEEIVVHEKYNKKLGPSGGNDIAIFKVNDKLMKNALSKRIYPACLPNSYRAKPQVGILSGWAPPPSFYYIEKNSQSLVQHYGDLFKQFHYKMEIQKSCEDPNRFKIYGRDILYPSNTSYPSGTICAKESERHCFSGGDSGSPLMVADLSVSSRYYIEGIHSFLKGCELNKVGNRTKFFALQQESPSVFTKLSCFLPWIAKQYNLNYIHESDELCNVATGDPEDKDKVEDCREAIGDPGSEEQECMFPFFYEGELLKECTLISSGAEYIIPEFRCPTRDITTKKSLGKQLINSYTYESVGFGEYCLDQNEILDPKINCSRPETFLALVPCKNNCKGVRGIGIVAGGALVAIAAGAAGLGALAQAAAGLGLLSIGGAGAMIAGCMGPLFCTALSGQCCLVIFGLSSGVVCPIDC